MVRVQTFFCFSTQGLSLPGSTQCARPLDSSQNGNLSLISVVMSSVKENADSSQQGGKVGQGPTAQDLAMMERAIREAGRAIDAGKAGVAALLLWRNEIVALDHNRYAETGDMTAHGEMVV